MFSVKKTLSEAVNGVPRGRVSLLGESLKDKLIIPEAGTGMDGPNFKTFNTGIDGRSH